MKWSLAIMRFTFTLICRSFLCNLVFWVLRPDWLSIDPHHAPPPAQVDSSARFTQIKQIFVFFPESFELCSEEFSRPEHVTCQTNHEYLTGFTHPVIFRT